MKRTSNGSAGLLPAFLFAAGGLLTASLMVSLAGLSPAQAAPKRDNLAPRIAFVDTGWILDSDSKSKPLAKQTARMRRQAQNEEQERIKKIETLKGEIDTLKKGSDKRIQKENELIAQAAVYKVSKARHKAKIAKLGRDHTKQLIADLKKAIRKIARQEGFVAVLTVTRKDPPSSNIDVQRYYIESQPVAYYRPDTDITKRVAQLLAIDLSRSGPAPRKKPTRGTK